MAAALTLGAPSVYSQPVAADADTVVAQRAAAAEPEAVWHLADWAVVAATILGPLAAVYATLWGQRRSAARDHAARSARVRVAVAHEVNANLERADALRAEIGEATRLAADRRRAALRLAARGVPHWERDAYTSLLAELPDAMPTDEAMRGLAEHHTRLQEMNWCQAELRSIEADGLGADDRMLALWERYAAARARLSELGNPVPSVA